MHAFHIPISINLGNSLIKMGEIIFSLLIEPDVDKVPTMKAEDDREGEEKNKTKEGRTFPLYLMKVNF